ncbi:MAG TPA: hypothetical protein VGR58_11765 [Candidatus Acidoferrum sp.]|nr:hypothetical protein [Candidatus Acidoferrum sp.]
MNGTVLKEVRGATCQLRPLEVDQIEWDNNNNLVSGSGHIATSAPENAQ